MISSSPQPRSMRILVVAEDTAVRALASRVLERRGDEVIVSASLADGVERGVELSPDVAFVDVSEHQRMGLTLVHALRAALLRGSVYALCTRNAIDAGAQALSLGADGVILIPPTGDELLLAVDKARERLATDDLALTLRAEAGTLRLAVVEATKLAQLQRRTFQSVVRALLVAVSTATSATRVAIYARDDAGGHRLVTSTEGAGFAPSCEDDTELADVAERARALYVPVYPRPAAPPKTTAADGSPHTPDQVRGQTQVAEGAVTMLVAAPAPSPNDAGLQLLVQLAANLLAETKERETLSDGAMKDPASSAYSFGYFVDVAGREIDKARRYGRRFALVSLAVDPGASLPALEVAERVLRVARDIDVLARVDESELLLLMPEADGLEVNDLRQRLVVALAHIEGSTPPRGGSIRAPQGITVGTSTFPHDGEDLTQLLRVARRRAEATRVSVVERLRLEGMVLSDVVDTLLWDHDLSHGHGPRSPESARAIELPVAEVVSLVSSALAYGLRGGAGIVTVTQRDELGLAAGLRMASAGEGFEVRAHDVRSMPSCESVEAFAIVAEHASYALLGRLDNGVFRGVHAADPMLATLVAGLVADVPPIRRAG
jgi:CheY-like chemotaxis protein